MASSTTPIRAAGVVVLRGKASALEVLIVHRAQRRDWSLPKGKLDPEEHALVAAVRECREEAGVEPVLGVPLRQMTYTVDGRAKSVDYWAARVGRADARLPDDEVDEVRWVPVAEASALLTYPRDAALVADAARTPTTSPLILLRHAQAMKRADFSGRDDNLRPLTKKGRRQSRELLPLLKAYAIGKVNSSTALRCLDTVRPYADANDLPVSLEPALSELGYLADPARASERSASILADRTPTVLCSHRPVLPAIVAVLGAARRSPGVSTTAIDPALAPSDFLVLHRSFGPGGAVRIEAVERHRLR